MKSIGLFFTIFVLFISINLKAKIVVIDPKDQDWLSSVDDATELEIKGEAKEFEEGTDVEVSIAKDIWKGKIKKNGIFSVVIDPFKIKPWDKTKINFRVLSRGKIKVKDSIDVFCCSSKRYGFYEKLIPFKYQKIKVVKPGTDINDIEVIIPEGVITSEANLFISVDNYGSSLSRSGYIPLSSPVSIRLNKNFKSFDKVEFVLPMYFDIPRNGFGEETTPAVWESNIGRMIVWKKTDLKSHKIVVLANDGEWKEIIPLKISGSKIYFKLPKDHSFFKFLPVALVPE